MRIAVECPECGHNIERSEGERGQSLAGTVAEKMAQHERVTGHEMSTNLHMRMVIIT